MGRSLVLRPLKEEKKTYRDIELDQTQLSTFEQTENLKCVRPKL